MNMGMEKQEILTFSYKNKKILTAVDTDPCHFNDMIAYMVSERLLEGPTAPLEFDNQMLAYMVSCLGELDKPSALIIYEEMRKRVTEISEDPIYYSLLVSGEFYLKYDYEFNADFTRIRLYVNAEFDWE
ncbi:hypothetical protein PQD71_gp116 [Kosakonia phage Kc263]|uniref:Uncharacterized protein n=1 Tax=Kosakonia phage Kc263 TaxID=2863194 RepID=A0AAE7WF91_9CAUD|nr:hypothetical protein PQD71_gp116 [Kosakonia phage Kc263]QYN80009.1 hypothetical protein [Kosakonia phage Kc263]